MVLFRDSHQSRDIPENTLVLATQTRQGFRSKFLSNGYSLYTLYFPPLLFHWDIISSSLCNLWTRKVAGPSSKDDNLPAKWETKKDIVLPNVVYNKLKLDSSPHKSKSVLDRKREMDYVVWVSDEHWDVEQLHRCDLFLLPITKTRSLCQHDCSMVAITNN